MLKEGDLAKLGMHRLDNPIPVLRRRTQALWGLGQGYSRSEASVIAGVSQSSVCNYIKMYNKGGLPAILSLNYKGPCDALVGHRVEIAAMLEADPPRTAKEAASRIGATTGVHLRERQVARYLHQMGFRPIKTGQIPGKADPQKQSAFIAATLACLVAQAFKGQCMLFFMDAAHFTLGDFSTRVWSRTRLFLPSGAGRNRINVLGAIDLVKRELIEITNTDYVNVETVKALLDKIAAAYKGMPIYIVLDNARYQHCEAVKAYAESLGITLKFLPPYSPNLNLIERLWRLVRKEALDGEYYDSPAKFHAAIRDIVARIDTDPDIRQKVETLITPKFQTFSGERILRA